MAPHAFKFRTGERSSLAGAAKRCPALRKLFRRVFCCWYETNVREQAAGAGEDVVCSKWSLGVEAKPAGISASKALVDSLEVRREASKGGIR